MFVASTICATIAASLELLNADYTFVNERLARHYGIPGVYGTRFRRVTLPDHEQRGGLLAEGALLVTTSYPDRTSPVLRGKWLLNNIFGTPDSAASTGRGHATWKRNPARARPSMRERLAQHRTESVLQQLPFGDRSAGILAGEFRRDRRVAHDRRSGQTDRLDRRNRRAAQR